jgi:thymidylate kinase
VSGGPGRLIAVDGVNGRVVRDAARELARDHHRRRGAVSSWDASGIFDEVELADDDGTPPSVRTLLLLYAADLAFRLRWEIRPALVEGRIVIAAHYVETAIAFGGGSTTS